MVDVQEYDLRRNQPKERANLENGVHQIFRCFLFFFFSDVFKRWDHEEGSPLDLNVPKFLDPVDQGLPEL